MTNIFTIRDRRHRATYLFVYAHAGPVQAGRCHPGSLDRATDVYMSHICHINIIYKHIERGVIVGRDSVYPLVLHGLKAPSEAMLQPAYRHFGENRNKSDANVLR